MDEIRYLSTRDVPVARTLDRVVAAAKADPGFWLMVKEREMERRALRAEVERPGTTMKPSDRSVASTLTPTIAEMVEDIVSRSVVNCPPALLIEAQRALLDAASVELNAMVLEPTAPPLDGPDGR